MPQPEYIYWDGHLAKSFKNESFKYGQPKKKNWLGNYKHDDLFSLESKIPTQIQMNFKDIFGKKWLDRDHMNLVNKLILDAGSSLHGFQDIMLVIIWEKNDKSQSMVWMSETTFSQYSLR